MDVAQTLETLRTLPPPLVWAALFFASFVEYVFPPFPGDTLVVAGAALVAAGGFDVLPAAAAVVLGGVVGGIVDLEVGRRLARSGWIERLAEPRRERVLRLVAWFGRHGPVVLAMNRFFPGVRGLFFVAAGAAGVGRLPATLWASVSALAWSALLLGIGLWLGHDVDALARVVRSWNLLVGVLVGLAVLGLAITLVRGRRG